MTGTGTYDFATSSRQDQLEQFVEQYFGDIGYDIVYGGDGGQSRSGQFIDPGKSYKGKTYEKGAIVINEDAFKKGWSELGKTVLHELLEAYRGDELTHDEIYNLEKLWDLWYNQGGGQDDK